MKKMQYIFYFIFLFFSSCQSTGEKDTFIRLLTNDSSKFWDFRSIDNVEVPDCIEKYQCGKGLKINVNNSLDNYQYSNNKRVIKNISGDLYLNTKWEYIGNNIINIGDRCIVKKITEDSLILIMNKREVLFLKSCYKGD